MRGSDSPLTQGGRGSRDADDGGTRACGLKMRVRSECREPHSCLVPFEAGDGGACNCPPLRARSSARVLFEACRRQGGSGGGGAAVDRKSFQYDAGLSLGKVGEGGWLGGGSREFLSLREWRVERLPGRARSHTHGHRRA